MTQQIPKIAVCEKCGADNKQGVTHCVKCGNELFRDYYKGIQLRNMIITLGLFLLPFIIFSYVITFETSRHLENQVKQNLSYTVNVNTRVIKSFLEERKRDLLSIANVDISDLSAVKSRASFYKRLVREKPSFDFIAIADLQGTIVYATNGLGENVSQGMYFKKACQGEFYNSGIFYSDLLDTTAMIISVPLANGNNEIIGALFGSISLKKFYDLILDLRIGKTSEIFLVDDTDLFLSPSKLGGQVLREHGHYLDDNNPHTGKGGVLVHRDYRGEKVICAYKKFDDFHGYLVSEMDVNEALAPVARLKTVMLYIFLFFGGFLVFSSFFFSRQITHSLKNLTSALKSALDDVRQKKDTIDTINVELRKRLRDCQSLSKQLRVSEEYVKNIINSISSGVVAFDKNRIITYCNDVVRQLMKKTEIDANSYLFDVLPGLKNDTIIKSVDNLFTSKRPFHVRKLSVPIDGRELILSIAGFPIKVEDDVTGVTLLISDVTKEERIKAQMADYEKLSALSQLALGAAHEINNPLLGITSYIELLLEDEKDVERKTQAKQVLESAYRISETIRGLLNFARPSPPTFTKISINKLITETISFLNHQPLFRKTRINKNLADTVPQITADANQIRQVFINIFLNAAQAMPNGGTINVVSQKVKFEDYVEIKVTDSGSGISKEDLKRVFEPFFTTKKGEGTGLGLSISFSYIKNHNGQISIESEVSKGTEVTILLPIRQESRSHSEVTA
jgi:signal transduction histidine kinase/ribosomal protein L40E